MTLDDIEIAVKSQFTSAYKGKLTGESDGDHIRRVGELHQLACNREIEHLQNLALMVFVAIARLYAFDRRDIIDFLAIDKGQYNEYLQAYDNLLDQAFKIMDSGITLPPESKAGKIYNKSCLVRNHINLNVPVRLVPRKRYF
jgi:hypothetical protein